MTLRLFSYFLAVGMLSLSGASLIAQDSNFSWHAYGGSQKGTRYAPLTQINRENVEQLQQAWVFRTGEMGEGARSADKRTFEATPIYVDGLLYVVTPFNRVHAIDPDAGSEVWRFDPQVDRTRGFSEVTCRGVSTWTDGDWRRIYVATIDARLIALDAKTGQPVKEFGANGIVNLKAGIKIRDAGDYQVTSPPAVIGDLIVVGSSVGDNRAVDIERGTVRAYDARSGEPRWKWDPLPADPAGAAAAGWQPRQASRTGAANVWSTISADSEHGLIFLPTSSPAPDFYGGERIGDNRYANSVVALHAESGKVAWHFQTVHHDLWDYDIAAQPLLADIEMDGKRVPAVVQATKLGHLFVLHRETGQPLYPVEERPVPQSDIPGEQSSPTQPFPVKPASLMPTHFGPEDAWGPTPQHAEECRQLMQSLRNDGLFTPPSLQGSLLYPGNGAGTNWGSVAFDPASNLLIANTMRFATVVTLVPRKDLSAAYEKRRPGMEFARQSGTPYGMYRYTLASSAGLPCNPPPWGKLAAVDLSTGELRWEVPLGNLMMPDGSKISGTINTGGPIVTAGGLIFIAATWNDDFLRAFDLHTGDLLWQAPLPSSGLATPMTFKSEKSGKQFVVIAAGGHGKYPPGTGLGDYLVAFTLADKE